MILRAFRAGVAAALLLASVLAIPARPAGAGQTADPSGALLAGKERLPGFKKSAVTLHLAPDGTAVGGFLDPAALVAAWTGNWTDDGTTITVDLVPFLGPGDPITCVLRRTASGAKGTVTRMGATPVTTRTSLKRLHPPRKPKGWTAIVPHLRDTGGAAAGDFRGTVVIRSLVATGKKRMPLTIQVVGEDGLPGLPVHRTAEPGEVLRFEGPTLPPLPPGSGGGAFQVVVSGVKGFGPDTV